MENSSIEILGISIPPYFYAPAFFFLFLIIFFGIKSFIFHRIKKWGEKTKTRWDIMLLRTLNAPLNLVIVSIGFFLIQTLLPLSVSVDNALSVVQKILIILAVFIFIDHFVLHLIRRFGKRMGALDLSGGIVQTLIRLVIFSLALLIILDSLGISITPLIASIGIGSLAVALGLQETLVNLFAGVYIIADQPIRTGDFIRLETGEEGYVTEIGWRNTRIRTLPNTMVIAPNNKIISSTIRNFYLPDKEIAVLVEVSVDYASDLAKVERVTKEVGKEIHQKVQGTVKSFEPFIRFHTFAESSINFTVVLRANEFTDQYLIKHEFMKALHDRYQKENIIFPFPMRVLDVTPQTIEAIKSAIK